jgi:hypothetical protein
MGKETRIRWQNVAKLAGGAVACIALVAGLPAALKRPKPPPLPADVGLTHVADRSAAASLSAAHTTHDEHVEKRAAHARAGHQQHRESNAPSPHHRQSTKSHRPEAPDSPQPSPVAAPVFSAPAPSTPTPAAAPAPAYSPPPPPAPAPTPVTTSSSPSPSGGGGGDQSGPSEFGFEH